MGMKICYIHKIKLYSTTKKQCIHEAFRKMGRNGKQALFEEKKSGLRKYIFFLTCRSKPPTLKYAYLCGSKYM